MHRNYFLESLSLPPFADVPSGETVDDYMIYKDDSMAYHGSPFSPEQMGAVFERHGYPESAWALLPMQPRRLNAEGVPEAYGNGPSVSAGTVSDALSRAFLHRGADHFVELQNTAGFSSSGFIDSGRMTTAVVPRAVGEALVYHEPASNLYRVDIGEGSGFKPLAFESEMDAIYDAGEYRSALITKPLGALTVSFAEFCDSKPIIVADCTLQQLNVLQRSLLLQAIKTPEVYGACELVDYFVDQGVKSQLLSSM